MIDIDGVIIAKGDDVVKPPEERVFVRSAYNYDMDAASAKSGTEAGGDSMTQQEFKEESDINVLVRRFGLTGDWPQDLRMPQSGDFSEVTDFQDAMNAVVRAQEEFMKLPGEMRARFYNDPAKLIEFMEDPRNREEAVKLGLVNAPPAPPAPPAPAPAPVAPS